MTVFTPNRVLVAAVASGVLAMGLPRLFPDQVPGLATTLLYTLALVLAFVALLRWRMPDSCDAAPAVLRKRYTREMAIAMGAYVVVLFFSVWLLKRLDLAPAVRALVALLPLPPIAFALRAIVRYIRDVDEMQQRIELEAVSIATAFVSLVYMAGGFLQAAKVVDLPASAAMIWMFPLVCFSYGLAKAFIVGRYR
jgi:hypothetical protein